MKIYEIFLVLPENVPDFSLFQKNDEDIFELYKKILGFSHFLCHFCKIYLIFHCSRKIMKVYLNSIEKSALIWYVNMHGSDNLKYKNSHKYIMNQEE